MPTYDIATIEGLSPEALAVCRRSGPSVLPVMPALPSMTEVAAAQTEAAAQVQARMAQAVRATRREAGRVPIRSGAVHAPARADGLVPGPGRIVPGPSPRDPQADAMAWKAEMLARAADVEEALRAVDAGDPAFVGQALSAGRRMAEAAVRARIAIDRARVRMQVRAADGRGDAVLAQRGHATLQTLARRDTAITDALQRLRQPEPPGGQWSRRTLTTWVQALAPALDAECRRAAGEG